MERVFVGNFAFGPTQRMNKTLNSEEFYNRLFVSHSSSSVNISRPRFQFSNLISDLDSINHFTSFDTSLKSIKIRHHKQSVFERTTPITFMFPYIPGSRHLLSNRVSDFERAKCIHSVKLSSVQGHNNKINSGWHMLS